MDIRLENVGKAYEGWIFRNIDTSFSANNIHAITGQNGSGKSTLLQMIAGFVTPSEGKIHWDNGKTTVDDLYVHLSLSAPYLDLMEEFTVGESLDLHQRFKPFLKNVSPASIMGAIELQSHRHKTVNKLSSGMKQRLKLALAIFTNSKLLLLDEPCSNLDARWAQWFVQTLNANSSGRTVVIASNSHETELECVNGTTLDVSAFTPL